MVTPAGILLTLLCRSRNLSPVPDSCSWLRSSVVSSTQLVLASPLAALYTFSDGTGSMLGAYGVIVLLRKPHRFLSVDMVLLPSAMGRSLLICRVAIEGKDVIIATVHLESGRNYAPTRAAQLGVIFAAQELTSAGPW